MVGTTHPHRITRILAIYTQSALKTDMTADNVGANVDVRGLDTDALTRCRLSGNGGIGLSEIRIEVEFDDAADVEHDISRSLQRHKSVEQ